MKRIPIQISAIPETTEGTESLYALSDDGTIWRIDRASAGQAPSDWVRLADLPGLSNRVNRLIETALALSRHDHLRDKREGLEPCLELQFLDEALRQLQDG